MSSPGAVMPTLSNNQPKVYSYFSYPSKAKISDSTHEPCAQCQLPRWICHSGHTQGFGSLSQGSGSQTPALSHALEVASDCSPESKFRKVFSVELGKEKYIRQFFWAGLWNHLQTADKNQMMTLLYKAFSFTQCPFYMDTLISLHVFINLLTFLLHIASSLRFPPPSLLLTTM